MTVSSAVMAFMAWASMSEVSGKTVKASATASLSFWKNRWTQESLLVGCLPCAALVKVLDPHCATPSHQKHSHESIGRRYRLILSSQAPTPWFNARVLTAARRVWRHLTAIVCDHGNATPNSAMSSDESVVSAICTCVRGTATTGPRATSRHVQSQRWSATLHFA